MWCLSVKHRLHWNCVFILVFVPRLCFVVVNGMESVRRERSTTASTNRPITVLYGCSLCVYVWRYDTRAQRKKTAATTRRCRCEIGAAAFACTRCVAHYDGSVFQVLQFFSCALVFVFVHLLLPPVDVVVGAVCHARIDQPIQLIRWYETNHVLTFADAIHILCGNVFACCR